jgi:hypothetical protein
MRVALLTFFSCVTLAQQFNGAQALFFVYCSCREGLLRVVGVVIPRKGARPSLIQLFGKERHCSYGERQAAVAVDAWQLFVRWR